MCRIMKSSVIYSIVSPVPRYVRTHIQVVQLSLRMTAAFRSARILFSFDQVKLSFPNVYTPHCDGSCNMHVYNRIGIRCERSRTRLIRLVFLVYLRAYGIFWFYDLQSWNFCKIKNEAHNFFWFITSSLIQESQIMPKLQMNRNIFAAYIQYLKLYL